MMIDNDTKRKLVVDASIAVKWFAEEENTSKAEVILNHILNNKILAFAPELLFYEVGNSLWKSKRFEKERIAASLNSLFDSRIQFQPINAMLSEITIDLMVKYDLTFYDATYGALAQLLQAPLLTANPKDHKKIKEIEVLEL